LYQTNPFSRGQGDDETGQITYQLASTEVAPTAEELQAMADEEEDEQALSQAINTLISTTRVGRNAKASEKVLLNRKQALEGSRGGCGSCGGGRGSRGRA
jgi:hypothetical protein